MSGKIWSKSSHSHEKQPLTQKRVKKYIVLTSNLSAPLFFFCLPVQRLILSPGEWAPNQSTEVCIWIFSYLFIGGGCGSTNDFLHSSPSALIYIYVHSWKARTSMDVNQRWDCHFRFNKRYIKPATPKDNWCDFFSFLISIESRYQTFGITPFMELRLYDAGITLPRESKY